MITDFDASEDRILLGEGLAVESYKVNDEDRDGVLDLSIRFTSGTSVTLIGVSDFDAVRFEASTHAVDYDTGLEPHIAIIDYSSFSSIGMQTLITA